MLGMALLEADRGDAFGRGATGYGVRMLTELQSAICHALTDVADHHRLGF
jgi:hypothetical protein